MSAVIEHQPQRASLVQKIATRYSVDPQKMLQTLKSTAFKADVEVSNEQMMALLIVADQYELNPFTKEIYAFPDKKGIVPVVGVDGWLRIINSHPQYDGVEYVDGPDDKNGLPAWVECVIYRKDRSHATRAREYMAECKRGTGPWQSHPRRMLRHKATIQAARLAFGFVGIYDQDEAQRIVEGDVRVVDNPAIDLINAQIAPAATVVEPVETPSASARSRTRPQPVTDAPTEQPVLTYAQVRAQLEAATTPDALDAAADLIATVAEAAHRDELAALYQSLRGLREGA